MTTVNGRHSANMLRLFYDFCGCATVRLLTVTGGKNKSFEHFENCATAKMTLRKRDDLSRKTAVMYTDPERT
jgi:hypothetical protein